MIYAIRAIGLDVIKYGKAEHVGRRLVQLDQASPVELEVIATADWPDGAETLIHRLLAIHNKKGEWFVDSRLGRQIIEWMGNRDLGLDRLHHEAKRSGLIAEREAPMTREEKRRSERLQWWGKHRQTHGQTHTKAATPRGNQAEDQG